VDVALLKAPSFADFNGRGLPYRVDLLRESGFELHFSDGRHAWPLAGPGGGRTLSRLGPLIETALQMPAIVRAPVALAIFESQGHVLALLRALKPGRHRRKLVVVACWLAAIAEELTPTKRALYRRMYRAVDLVIVFSNNQREILQRELAIPPDRVAFVPFGIDVDELRGVEPTERGAVVAVGRDAGRDWPTFFDAVRGTAWDVHVACRQRSVAGLAAPAETTLHGFLDRHAYLDLLARASVVVVATKDLAYPSGQTVLLEAMALGKPCVVTKTRAMDDYVQDGVDSLTVPPHDPPALRAAIRRLLGDAALRAAIGGRARERAFRDADARTMWKRIGELLRGLDGA
jgi:glycosyltransferase involved in cell wall biosynthesis